MKNTDLKMDRILDWRILTLNFTVTCSALILLSGIGKHYLVQTGSISRSSSTWMDVLNPGDMHQSPAAIRITTKYIPGRSGLKIDSALLTTSDGLSGWWDMDCGPALSLTITTHCHTAAAGRHKTIRTTSIIVEAIMDPKQSPLSHQRQH